MKLGLENFDENYFNLRKTSDNWYAVTFYGEGVFNFTQKYFEPGCIQVEGRNYDTPDIHVFRINGSEIVLVNGYGCYKSSWFNDILPKIMKDFLTQGFEFELVYTDPPSVLDGI